MHYSDGFFPTSFFFFFYKFKLKDGVEGGVGMEEGGVREERC